MSIQATHLCTFYNFLSELIKTSFPHLHRAKLSFVRTSFRKFFAYQKKLKMSTLLFPNFSHFSSLHTLGTSYLVMALPHYVILPTCKRLHLWLNISQGNLSLPSQLPQYLYLPPVQPEFSPGHHRSYHYPL